jgi:hypothetical protein
MNGSESWPALPLNEWQDTYTTLHMWTQIVGKIRMKLSPPINHWWHTTLYVNARGLTTGPIPHSRGVFEIEFDFQSHELNVLTSEGQRARRPLRAEAVADFYGGVMECLAWLKIPVAINLKPQEVPNPTPFDQDFSNCSYDPVYARRFWQILVSTSKVLHVFRSKFIGKCSPVHFFWGSFDLAVTRFSGRRAPERPDADALTREAYSHEVSSVGWWPGDSRLKVPSFYSYAAPEPAGFRTAAIKPSAAYYNEPLGGFYLHYDDVRLSSDPEQTLLDFCHTVYDSAADNGHWDRNALERQHV